MFEVERIVREVKPKAIAIFGSAAEGKAGKYSDVDLLVITPDDASRRLAVELEKELSGIEIHAVTARRALELIHAGDPFFTKILMESRPLYGHFYVKFLREVVRNVGKSKNLVGEK